MKLYIGTSGWQYGDWNEVFYPPKLPPKDRLSFYAQQFPTVEINSTFYHMPRESTVQNWHATVPEDFVLTIKLNRYFTHLKRLAVDAEFEKALQAFLRSAQHCGRKLGSILVQLPPSLPKNYHKLEAFIAAIHRQEEALNCRLPLSIEFRHASWFDVEINDLLDKHGIANVISSATGIWPEQRTITGRRLYIRFHGDTELFHSSYSTKQLNQWTDFIRHYQNEFNVGHIYFNNCYDGVGLQNAQALRALLDANSAAES